MSDPRQTSLRDLLAVLRAQRVVVGACVALALGLSLGVSLSQDKKYSSSASLAFEDQSQDLALVGTASGITEPPAARAVREANTLLSVDVLEATARALKTRPSVAALRKSVSVAPENTSNLVVVTATASDADTAAAVANAVTSTAARLETEQGRERFNAAARDLEKRSESLLKGQGRDVASQQLYRDRIARLDALASVSEPVTIASIAEPPDAPSSPRPVRSAILAGLAGLLIGTFAAFLRSALDRRFRDSYDIREQLDLPLLGYVSEDAMGKTGFTTNGRVPMAKNDLEAFRRLRANLDFLAVDTESKVILITSALPQEGKSTVAASLAFVSARSNQRTLLVECDLRRPSLADRLGVDRVPGLVELIVDGLDGREIVRSFELPPVSSSANGATTTSTAHPLYCSLAGRSTPQAAELVASSRLRDFVLHARQNYDLVIIDTAPLLPVVDTLELFPLVDAAILCVRDGRTTRDDAEAAKAALANLGNRPVGVVVTGVSPHDRSDYGYYSHSYSYSTR